MADTLYRRYRPSTFADLVDQRHVRITLEHALTQNRLAHAYIFTGPRGVGKTTVARLLARAVNCQQRGQGVEPCNRCPTCTAQLQGSSLDVVEIDAASQTGVDNVRENIIQSARAIPALGRMKVFIIDEVHMLSLAAFNALLKLLEEPPVHAMFILATTELHRVPETVISRTQRFDFKKIRIPDIMTRLEKLAVAEHRQLADGVAERIARAADGSLRDAESMLNQLFAFPDKQITTDLADVVMPRSDQAVVMGMTEAVVRGQTTTALSTLHRFIDDGGDVPIFIHELVGMARAVLLAAVDRRLLDEAMTTEAAPTLDAVAELATLQSPTFFVLMAETLLEAERLAQHAPVPAFPLEIAIIRLGGSEAGRAAGPASTVKPLPPVVIPPADGPTSRRPKKTTTGNGPAAETGQLDLAAATTAWATVQRQAAEERPGLAVSIKLASVQGVAGDHVTIAAPFKLHAERLNSVTLRAHLGDLLSAALGQTVTLTITQSDELPTVVPAAAPAPAPRPAAASGSTGPKNELWDQVVATFT